jgi:hypothetical protein
MKRLSISIHKQKACRKNIELSSVTRFAKPPKKGNLLRQQNRYVIKILQPATFLFQAQMKRAASMLDKHDHTSRVNKLLFHQGTQPTEM